MTTTIFILEKVLIVFSLLLLADFVTGVIHWLEDTYGNPNWPIIGKYIIIPNLEHHKNPRSLLSGNYWNRVDTSVYAACSIGILCYLSGYMCWQLFTFLLIASQGNEFHAIAHRNTDENGYWLTRLQKIGLIQTRKTHGWHHKAPYETNFCVMTEFLNPILNRINFWNTIEKILLKIFRIKILRGSDIRGGI